LFGVVLLLLCADWWLPSVLPTVLKHWDVQVGEITSVERGRWECVDVHYETDALHVSVDSLQVPSLWRYVQAYWQGTVAESLLVDVGQVKLELLPTKETSPSESEVHIASMLNEVRASLSKYARWIPQVTIAKVSVVSEQTEVVTVQAARFDDWQLVGDVTTTYFAASAVQVQASLSPEEAWHADLNAEAIGVEIKVDVDFTAQDRVALQLTAYQKGGALAAQATWVGEDVVPSEWSVNSNGFEIQCDWFEQLAALKVEQLQVSDLDITFGQKRYRGHLKLASALPIDQQDPLPFEAVLAVAGDYEVLSISQCEISGPWGALALSKTLEVDLKQYTVLQGADLTASIDLAKQTLLPASGHLDGAVTIAADQSKGIDLSFHLNGKSLSYEKYEAESVQLAGGILGDTIRLERLQLDLLSGTNADNVLISGEADWRKRSMDFQYDASIQADWLNEKLGGDYFADTLKSQGRIYGSFDAPTLQGHLPAVVVQHPQLNPMTVAGEIRSLSEGAIDVNLSANCGEASIAIDVAASLRDDVYGVELQKLVITDPELPVATLLAPASIRYAPKAKFGQRLQVQPLHVQSEDSELRMAWNATDGFSLLLRNIVSQRLDRWLKLDVPKHQIDLIDVALTQLEPRILGGVTVHAQGDLPTGEECRVDFVSDIDTAGVLLKEIDLKFAGKSLATGELGIPLRLQLPNDGASFWAPIVDGHLSGKFTAATTEPFTQWLASFANVQLGEASVHLALSGAWTEPLGDLELNVEQLTLGGHAEANKLPVLTELQVKAQVNGDTAEIQQFKGLLNQSLLQATASLPTDDLLKLMHAEPKTVAEFEALLQNATASLDLKDWKFENWHALFPAAMRQSGELDGQFVLGKGLDLSGSLVLDGFALRPTLAYSMVDQIGAEFELNDRVLQIKRASARVGGSLLSFAGHFDGTDLNEPLWELTATGERVPLVRTSDLILRSDVDLKFAREKAAEPELSGKLNFTKSTLLVEFDPLAPSVESGPSSHPPYFSITTPSIADWKFNLVASGDSFLQVRSPYFRALISANLTLEGTFIKPELLGSLRVASGSILFPSVKMDLDTGEAFIEQTRPNEVQLNMSGIAELSPYVVTMEIGQTVSEPSVTFSSTPTLPNSQIVRLLATGGLTGGNAGAVGVYLGKGLLGVGAGGVNSSLADRLTIDVGEAGGVDGGNTFDVKYRLTDRMSLQSGYGIGSEYSIDLLWSVFKQ
jgi:translocation and assembly module TamB